MTKNIEGTGGERIDAAARREERKSARARMRLPPRTGRRLLLVTGVYVGGFGLLMTAGRRVSPASETGTVIVSVVLLAFVFETLDSSAGMGFGTALAPLLFVLGFAPLEVVPALLAVEATTGLLAGLLHHEFRNIEFRWRPPNPAARTLLLVGGLGAMGAVTSVVVAYLALPVPEKAIKTYVAVLVLVMGGTLLLRHWLTPGRVYRPRRLVIFATVGGVNKGLGGGGFGPVITLGSIHSGIIEKSATAIATLAEGCVSVFGIVAFLGIAAAGVAVDLSLLPSLWLGAFPAAVLAPYAVRVLPNRIWRYVIPLYALGVAGWVLVEFYGGS